MQIKSLDDKEDISAKLEKKGYAVIDMTDNEMAKNHEQHLSPTDNSNEMINLLSQVQRLLNNLSETADFSANIHHPLNRTEQFQGNAEKSPVGSNVGNIYKVQIIYCYEEEELNLLSTSQAMTGVV